MATILEKIQEKWRASFPEIDNARNIAEAVGIVYGTGGRGSGNIADTLYGYYTFTFDPNGGIGNSFTYRFIKNSDVVYIPECPFVAPEGKVFGYWILHSDVEEYDDHLTPGPADYGTIGDKTLYAGWVDAE